MDFYKRLLSVKAIQGLSWGDIGRTIDKEATTMRIAVSRKSLSILEQREIEKMFLSENEPNDVNNDTYEGDYGNLKPMPIKELAFRVSLREEELMKENAFSNIIEKKVLERLLELKAPEEYKQYLKTKD